MNKLAIISDQCSGLDESYGYSHLYFCKNPYSIDGNTFYNLKTDELISAQKKDFKITTSMPNIGEVLELIDKLLLNYEKILVFTIPSYLSGFFNTLSTMIENHPCKNRIRIVNISTLAYPLEKVLIKLINNIDNISNIDEYIDYLESTYEFSCILCPYSLTFLANGGRVPSTVASLANLLKIVALIEFNQLESKLIDKVRLHKKAYQKAMAKVIDMTNNKDVEYFILYNGVEKTVIEKLLIDFEKLTNKKIVIKEIPPLILAHTGYNSIGFGYCTKL